MTPNIVIIALDAARAQNFPFYGYQRNTTPFLWGNKEKFAVYENAISSSYWTMPSVASLFTGMYTSGHGLVADGDKLDEKIPTLPGILKTKGYRNVAFVRNVYVSEYSGLSKNFDEFFSITGLDHAKNIMEKLAKNWLGNLQPCGIKNVNYKLNGNTNRKIINNIIARLTDLSVDSGGNRFISDFKKWLRKYHEKPFFAYFHFMETHLPFRAPHRYSLNYLTLRENIRKLTINHNHMDFLLGRRRMYEKDFDILRGAYDNAIRYIDHLVMHICNMLVEYKVIDNTMIIITSDHGENIGDHGLMFHYWCLFDTLIKVPLLIKYPKPISLKGRIESIAQNVDILPTILKILDEKEERHYEFLQGNDLLYKTFYRRPKNIAISELLKPFGMDRYIYRDRFKKFDKRLLSVRTKDKKFIYSSKNNHECYDLKKDANELKNLYPEIKGFEDLFRYSEYFYQKMDKFYQKNKFRIEGNTASKYTESRIMESLKTLGYM